MPARSPSICGPLKVKLGLTPPMKLESLDRVLSK
jgi:hypothetical protein